MSRTRSTVLNVCARVREEASAAKLFTNLLGNYPRSRKILIIMRGLPGSGKSMLAKSLVQNGLVLSSDDFWGDPYTFNPSLLGEAHRWNQHRAGQAIAEGSSPFVIDNTNVEAVEYSPYVKLACSNGYRIKFIEPQIPWKFDVEELAARNSHAVRSDVIKAMLSRWQQRSSVLRGLRARRLRRYE